eukprot:9874-Rhodomonas_salina.1
MIEISNNSCFPIVPVIDEYAGKKSTEGKAKSHARKTPPIRSDQTNGPELRRCIVIVHFPSAAPERFSTRRSCDTWRCREGTPVKGIVGSGSTKNSHIPASNARQAEIRWIQLSFQPEETVHGC